MGFDLPKNPKIRSSFSNYTKGKNDLLPKGTKVITDVAGLAQLPLSEAFDKIILFKCGTIINYCEIDNNVVHFLNKTFFLYEIFNCIVDFFY